MRNPKKKCNCPFVVQIIWELQKMFSYGVIYFIFKSECGQLRSSGIQFIHECNKHSVIWIIPKYFRSQYSSKFVVLCQAPRTSKIPYKSFYKEYLQAHYCHYNIPFLVPIQLSILSFPLVIKPVAPVVAFLPCCGQIMLRVCRCRSVDTMVSVQYSVLLLTNPFDVITQSFLVLNKSWDLFGGLQSNVPNTVFSVFVSGAAIVRLFS